jgi:hypothetical protein
VQQQLSDFIADLVAEAEGAGEVRDDVPPKELARYCLHALAVASELPSRAAVRRLVSVTLAGYGLRRDFSERPGSDAPVSQRGGTRSTDRGGTERKLSIRPVALARMIEPLQSGTDHHTPENVASARK